MAKGVVSRQAWHFNTGEGPAFQPIDIGDPDYICLVEPDTAFWALVERNKAADALADGRLKAAYGRKAASFRKEMADLRFSQRPSAVYFNPTERCNLNCSYCYIPEKMRRSGRQMDEKRLTQALGILKGYFSRTLPKGTVPQVIFHGAEPLLAKGALLAGIERYSGDFLFGVQTNATALDGDTVGFLKERGVSIGLSLDAPTAPIAARTRKDWAGNGVFDKAIEAMELLRGYPNWSVICTVTSENLKHLTRLVELFHRMEAPSCMLNVVRCTLEGARKVKPTDAAASRHFLAALDRTRELHLETGRKMPVANFANILISILAPTARRLMCDISPCGGGRCFFALAPNGDLFPCSEFIGLKEFRGGNLFRDALGEVLKSRAFGRVTGRKVEDIEDCKRCAIRHFCGSPCPAEAHEMNGGMEKKGAFCAFYEEQVRYAFRLIARGVEASYLWDGWDRGTKPVFSM